MKYLFLVFSFFIATESVSAQSKYMDYLRTTPSLIGGLGFTENSISRILGFNLSVKGSIDFGIQVGSILLEEPAMNKPPNFDERGTVVSGQTYMFLANQRRNNAVNFGITFAGSASYFEHIEVTNMGAGLFLSGNNMKPQKIRVTPSLEVLYLIINEAKEVRSGRTFVGDPIISGSFSLGLSTIMSDTNILIFEPGLIYNDSTKKINFGLTLGIIF